MEYNPDIDIKVTDEVYPPSEDSILLIESLDVREGEKVLEIGPGSGVVSIHCAKNGCKVTSADINPYAVECTRNNAKANNVDITVVESDLYENVEGRFDTIIFNLPYLPVDDDGELAKAWSGGEDGIGPLPGLLNGSAEHLTPGGRIVIVVSSLMDEKRLNSLLSPYDVKVLGELPLFFERLRVLEIRRLSL
jgi:release factor glutamine methyltransferase